MADPSDPAEVLLDVVMALAEHDLLLPEHLEGGDDDWSVLMRRAANTVGWP